MEKGKIRLKKNCRCRMYSVKNFFSHIENDENAENNCIFLNFIHTDGAASRKQNVFLFLCVNKIPFKTFALE